MVRWLMTALLLLSFYTTLITEADGGSREPMRIVVMDPLCDQLACDCVAGYAQRKYGELATFLEEKLKRQVYVGYTESLTSLSRDELATIDAIIGKYSLVRFDAKRTDIPIRTLAMLSDKNGSVTQTGLFIVRTADEAHTIKDIRDYRVMFGPLDCDEKNAAAIATLDVFGVSVPQENHLTAADCSGAALAVVENDADAGVISDYAMPLLEGCGKVDQGALRVVGKTSPVPFITVFATRRLHGEEANECEAALEQVALDAKLLRAMESKHGFVALPNIHHASWKDWRGPQRAAISNDVPNRLPDEKQLLWSRTMTGHGLSGIAVHDGRLVVADKSLDTHNDIFRCLDADTGRQLWKIEYPAPGKMDFTNSPRASPVIHEGVVYLLGAYGHLNCVDLKTGKVRWRRQLADDFKTTHPNWGYCGTPLIVDDTLIVAPGAEDASVVALEQETGKVVWQTSGQPCGYSSFVLATINGVRQIIGYESQSVCGYDPKTGERLWDFLPEYEGDFNVPTPIVLRNQLLLSTENNGTRLYAFDSHGRIKPEPIAQNLDMSPDMSTPIVTADVLLGSYGGLGCLDLKGSLKTCWETFDDPYFDYCSFIAGNDRVLVITQTGKLRLLEPNKKQLKCVSELDLFEDVRARDRDVWSHPALIGNRLYIRNSLAVYCFLLN